MAMLYFDIRSLEAKAELVDGLLAPGDSVWEATDIRPLLDGVQVTGRLSAAGHGRFYFSGHLSGTAAASCRRCLVDVAVRVTEDVQLLFAEAGMDEAEEDDVVPLAAGARVVDLRPAIREEWLLAVPGFALCREDCLGLCVTCGADRNSGACVCAPTIDPRWEGFSAKRDVLN